MFGIGTPELILIAVLLALILGPRNLPRAARKAGEVKREIDRMRGSLTSALDLRGMLDPTREPAPPDPRAEQRSSDPDAGESGKPIE
jgi:Sec-independent protein translocase protein TatA